MKFRFRSGLLLLISLPPLVALHGEEARIKRLDGTVILASQLTAEVEALVRKAKVTGAALSIGKAIFAFYVIQLVQKGILDMDKPLVEYLDKPLYEYTFVKSSQGYQSLRSDNRHKKITAL